MPQTVTETSAAMHWTTRPSKGVLSAGFVVATVLCLQLALFDFRPSNTSDDFTGYVSDALAVAHGTVYGMPDYILNKHYDLADSGQGAYPPGYPLVLAPIVAVAADPVHATALVNCVLYALFAGALTVFAAPVTGLTSAVAASLIAGLSPIFLNQGTMRVPTESLYLFVIMLAFIGERLLWTGGRYRPGFGSAVAVGALIAWASLIRITGVLLGPAAILADIARRRRLAWPVFLASAIAAVLFAGVILGVAQDYVIQNFGVLATEPEAHRGTAEVLEHAKVVLHNIAAMPGNLTAIATFTGAIPPSRTPSVELLRRVCTAGFAVLAAAGFVAQLRRRVTMAETYCILQTLLLLNLTSLLQSPRYWLPVSALALVYAFAGARVICAATRIGLPQLAPPMLAAAVAIGMIADPVAATLRTPDRYSLVEPRAVDAFARLARMTSAGDVVIARRPRTVVFYAHRKSADYSLAPTDPQFWDWAGSIGATHLLLSIDQPDVLAIARQRGLADHGDGLKTALDMFQAGFFGQHAGRFEPVFDNGRYRLFRIVPLAG